MHLKIALSVTIALFCLVGYFIIKGNTLTLVNYVVCRAFLQKAPSELSHEDIRLLFQRACQTARNSSVTRDLYIQDLFQLSQKLEKRQHISQKDAEELLDRIRSYIPSPEGAIPSGRK